MVARKTYNRDEMPTQKTRSTGHQVALSRQWGKGNGVLSHLGVERPRCGGEANDDWTAVQDRPCQFCLHSSRWRTIGSLDPDPDLDTPRICLTKSSIAMKGNLDS